MAESLPNALVSSSASDSSLMVQLHPLVLLTISDYIARHTLREQQDPIVGAIIGQQNGREVTMEHAFECKLKEQSDENGERVIVDDEWFAERIEQFKDVHKSPALDLVAIFTLAPATGPLPQHIPVLQQLQHQYNDQLVLLLFHPDSILDGSLTGGRLPISLYESYYEPGSEPADKGLQVDGWGMGRQLQMRFRQLSYEVETGEAEMIGVDFVAKGGGNATAIASTGATQKTAAESSTTNQTKTNGKTAETQSNGTAIETALSAEDEELVASLTAKSNAIKMLHQRINLIKSYLASLPSSHLTDISPTASTSTPAAQLNHPLLRNISSMLSRLPLLAPPTSALSTSSAPSSLATASAQEQSDVHLVSLLSSLTRSIADARDMGAKYAVVQKAKTEKSGLVPLGRSGGRGFGGQFPVDDPRGNSGESQAPEYGMGGMA